MEPDSNERRSGPPSSSFDRRTLRPSAPDAARPLDGLGAPVLLLALGSASRRDSTAEILRVAGYRVVIAADGLDALEAAHGADLDLLIADVDLPRLDGPFVARRLTVDRPWLKVLFTSPTPAGTDALTHPWTQEELLARIGPLVAAARRARPARPGPCAAEDSTDTLTTVKRYRR